jgi:hypothetical protein
MISIEKLVQQLQQCKDTSITLPSSNESKYVQSTAFDIRKSELELLNNNFEVLNDINYTMDCELEKLNNNLQNGINNNNQNNNNNTNNNTNNHTNNNHNLSNGINNNNFNNTNNNYNSNSNTNNNSKYKNKEYSQDIIPSKSLIIYTENETATIPEIILKLLPDNLFKPSEWYIYGVKNPESFYKSFLLLSKLDFIIKNKTEKKNEVATFKREMAIQYETFYKELNYRKYKFPRNEMVNNLTEIDNYTEFDALQYISDYSKLNYIILDIVTEKYFDVKYNTNPSDSNPILSNEFVIIIKYASNTYLPLMNSNGKHKFHNSIINIISKHFERIVFAKYKEPSMVNLTEGCNEDCTEDSTKAITDESDKLTYNIEDIYNISNESIIENIMESITKGETNVETSGYGLKHKSLINKNVSGINVSDIINGHNEDMDDIIDIEEQEEEPIELLQNKIKLIESIASIASIAKNDTVIKVDNFFNPKYNNNNINYNNPKQCNDIDSLLSRIPMSSDIKQKKTKKDIALEAKLAKSVSASATASASASISETPVLSTTNDKEELKPLAKYNLVDLQILAKLYKVDTKKMGNCDNKVNKLKSELYDEIKAKW